MHITVTFLMVMMMYLLCSTIILFPKKKLLPNIEEVLHLLSIDELRLSHAAVTNIQRDIGPIKHFVFYGKSIACGYGFHWKIDEIESDVIFFEFVEILILEDQTGLRLEFEGGEPKEWRTTPRGNPRAPLDRHQKWVFEQMLSTVKNATNQQTQGVLL